MNDGYTAIVCGSRTNQRRDWTFAMLDDVDRELPIAHVIEGGNRLKFAGERIGSADWYAEEWAIARGRRVTTIEADWKQLGRRAGPIRNGEMIWRGKPDFTLALPGGCGTENMIQQSRQAHVRVIDIRERARFCYVPRLFPELCRAWPSALHVFGDNFEGWGRKGQAIIRREPNAFGIPTKWAPRGDDAAYFTDADFDRVAAALTPRFGALRAHIEAGRTVFWPEAGIGGGLAELHARAPRIAAAIQRAEERLLTIAAPRASLAN